jgi:protein Mpv17
MVAGWKVWPLVALVNYTMVRTVQGRSLVGGLAGLGWDVSVSLVAAR